MNKSSVINHQSMAHHGKVCHNCLKPANYVCADCFSAFYCGNRCNRGHECTLIAAAQKRGADAPTTLEQTRTIEDARRLVAEGADPYEYIGNGKVALDEMVKWYPIREFLREASIDPPQEVKELIARAKANTVDVGKNEWVISSSEIGVYMCVDMLRLLIYHGFFPVFFERNGLTEDIAMEHLFFRRYRMPTLMYWLGIGGGQDLTKHITSFVYRTVAGHIEQARNSPNSFALLLFAPHMVYRESKRAKTDMAQFRTAESITIPREMASDRTTFLPVTRYASGMSRGLFYGDSSSFCGTFYYLEVESNAFLRIQNPLYAFDKHDAAFKLGLKKEYNERLEVEFPPNNRDLMLTPSEYEQWRPRKATNRILVDEDRKFYAAYLEDAYALQDDYDQPICEAAKRKGYDVVVLMHMVGSRQIVTEVLDVRDRKESFANLYFLGE